MTENDVTLFLCGDVMTGRGIDQILPFPSSAELYEGYITDARDYVALAEARNGSIPRPVGFDYIWGEALAELSRFRPAVRLINLETSITSTNTPWPDKGINYRMHPHNADCLKAAEVNVCALANNHLLDWGREGLTETLQVLDRLGIAHAGAGETSAAAMKPARLCLGPERRLLIWSIGLSDSGVAAEWSAQPGHSGVYWVDQTNPEMIDTLAQRIQTEKNSGDLVVVSVHWGSNWGYGIPPEHRSMGRRLIDAGADLIHGHSSHHPRGFELYRGKPILYGCGDFINDYEGIGGQTLFRPELTLMYFVRFDVETGELTRFWMTPLRMERFSLHKVDESEARWLCRLLNHKRHKESPRVTLDSAGRLLWI